MTGPSRRRAVRLFWAAAGLVMVGFGGLGLLLPGLPATMFFVTAAWCFARSDERLERWLLGLPVVGRLVDDYRSGLGMARNAKVVAIALMWAAVALSAVLSRSRLWLPVVIASAGVVGTLVVGWWVPTKERVLAARAAGGS
ncbi:MAG: YbaN family protein [Acidimicrobiia bacterium]